MTLNYIVLGFLLLSISLNILLIILRRKTKIQIQETYDARMLMQDLASGEALVRITRIAPSDIFLRSPRDL